MALLAPGAGSCQAWRFACRWVHVCSIMTLVLMLPVTVAAIGCVWADLPLKGYGYAREMQRGPPAKAPAKAPPTRGSECLLLGTGRQHCSIA